MAVMEGCDRAFRVNFSSEGVVKLRERVKEKLKEFMGDYTDDTLVEYVIVLLKNGRCKDEAKSELNVFLGDDSESFVSWLWDHLGSYLSLYVQQRELHLDEAPKTKSAAVEQDGRTESHKIESVAEKGSKTSGKHQNRERKEPVKDVNENENPLLHSSMDNKVNAENEPHRRVGHSKGSISPRSKSEKKRRRHDEQQPRKSEVSQTTVGAPRRLLQSAVRDAVATSRPSNAVEEPSSKRLRSVVSTSIGDSFVGDRAQRIRPEAGLRTAMSAAIKAVADAVKDVSKVRPSRNVFDRLGRDTDVSNTTNHLDEYGGVTEDAVGRDFSNKRESIRLAYRRQNGDNMQQGGNVTSFKDDTIMSPALGYDGEDDDVDTMGQGATHIYQPPSGGDGLDDSQNLQSDMTDGSYERVRLPHKTLDRFASVPGTSLKVSSSIHTNIWKLQHQEVSDVDKLDNHKLMQDSDTVAIKSQASLMKEKSNLKVAFNGNVKPNMGFQHEAQKTETPTGLYPTALPTEDADLRTIFVNNVHFAATKDSLSRHFNKFGEVLKVIILTDPATGQPKGSAYIEFMKKEAAEQALSLDGTSFMSRIVKIVRKSSAQPETSAVIWPRVARASPFVVPRARAPFARGFRGLYRSRTPKKSGPRSFQWKREAQPSGAEASGQAFNSFGPLPPTRSLTYVRTEPKTEAKPNESSGTA